MYTNYNFGLQNQKRGEVLLKIIKRGERKGSE
jgi:hypothetical protein